MSGTDDTRAEAIEAAARATATYWQDEVAAPDECDREAGKAAVDAAIPHLLAPIRALHRPDQYDRAFCRGCDRRHPCPTVRALDAIEAGSR